MTYIAAEPCIDVLDLTCTEVCPVDCIYYEQGVDRQVYIHPEECIECGACEPVCPVEAIYEETALPERWRHFYEINVQWFQDKEAVRARINALRPPGTPPAAHVR
jgi:ferredoxin